MKNIIYFIFIIVFSYLSYLIVSKELLQKKVNEKLVKSNEAQYGIFNPEKWKEKTIDIVLNYDITKHSGNISKFILAESVEQVSKMNLEKYRDSLNSEIFDRYSSIILDFRDKHPYWYKGIKFFFDPANIYSNYLYINQHQFQEYENLIKKELIVFLEINLAKIINNNLANNQDLYKDIIVSEINKSWKADNDENYIKNHSTILYSRIMHTLGREINNLIRYFLIVGLFFIIFVYFVNRGDNFNLNHFLLIDIQIIAFFLFIIGISTSMIEINAQLPNIDFMIANQNIQFENQVLYYQRKSILDVAFILFKYTPFVGFFIILFSIVFPILKIILLILSLLSSNLKNNFYFFQIMEIISKWSMADIFITSLFLSYFGTKGIFSNLANVLTDRSIINGALNTQFTKLHIGFYFFFVFVILSYFVSFYFSFKIKKNHFSIKKNQYQIKKDII